MKKNILILLSCTILSMADAGLNNEEIKKKLTQTLNEVKEYKLRKNRQIKKLHTQVDKLNRELKELKQKLLISNQKLSKVQNKLSQKEKVVKVKKKVAKKKIVKVVKKEPIKEIETPLLITKPTPSIEAIPIVEPIIIEIPQQRTTTNKEEPVKLSWIEIIVEDSIDIYQLALKYYNNRENYKNIYAMNRNVIDSNLVIRDGMSLKIPILENFEEQPVILNQD